MVSILMYLKKKKKVCLLSLLSFASPDPLRASGEYWRGLLVPCILPVACFVGGLRTRVKVSTLNSKFGDFWGVTLKSVVMTEHGVSGAVE